MKKNLNLVLAVFVIVSCYAQKERLELNLRKGELYTQNMTSAMTISQTMNGKTSETKVSLSGKTTYKVIDIHDTVYNIEVRYESLSMKMNMPTGTIEFSSDKKDEKDIFSNIMSTMIGKTFMVNMTKSGKINDVQGIESLFSGMFEKLPAMNEAQKKQITNQMMQTYGDKAFRGNMELGLSVFPNTSVSVGDQWVIHTNLQSTMNAGVKTTYELKEINGSYYIIGGKSELKTENNFSTAQPLGMNMKYDLTGTMNSESKIDRESGWIIEARIVQSIKGSASMDNNPQLPGGMTIPMDMHSEITITNQ